MSFVNKQTKTTVVGDMEMSQTSPYIEKKTPPKRRWKNCNLLFVSMKSKQKTPEKKKSTEKEDG
jgi:hypothetical protein